LKLKLCVDVQVASKLKFGSNTEVFVFFHTEKQIASKLSRRSLHIGFAFVALFPFLKPCAVIGDSVKAFHSGKKRAAQNVKLDLRNTIIHRITP